MRYVYHIGPQGMGCHGIVELSFRPFTSMFLVLVELLIYALDSTGHLVRK